MNADWKAHESILFLIRAHPRHPWSNPFLGISSVPSVFSVASVLAFDREDDLCEGGPMTDKNVCPTADKNSGADKNVHPTGFTLVELLVVIAIIAVLIGIL